jgi:hypothetical protein
MRRVLISEIDLQKILIHLGDLPDDATKTIPGYFPGGLVDVRFYVLRNVLYRREEAADAYFDHGGRLDHLRET